MDDVGLDGARLQPARQPEAVPPGLIGADDPPDRPSGLARFIPPALQQLQQSARVCIKLLQRLTHDSRDHSCNEPLRLAHLDHDDQCAILFEGGEGPAGVKRLRHGVLPCVITAPEDLHTLAAAPLPQWVTHCRHGRAQEARHAMAQGVTHGSEGRICSVVPAAGREPAELCRRFGISPRLATNGWLGRPRRGRTRRGIAPGDRMCLRSGVPTEIETAVLEIRDAYPAWGARKICRRLKDQHKSVPVASTVHAILARRGRIPPPAQPPQYIRFEHPAPNDVWQMDF